MHFLVENTNNQNNVTGTGTLYKVEFNQVIFDIESTFSNNQINDGNNKHIDLHYCLKMSGLNPILHNRVRIRLITTDQNHDLMDFNPAGFILGNGNLTVNGGVFMNYNVTGAAPFVGYLELMVAGGLTDTVDVLPGSIFSAAQGPY